MLTCILQVASHVKGMASYSKRSGCPIASSLDLIGDRWSLVSLRDLLNGKSRYAEFLASPEGISTNILADRLAAMEADGLVTRQPYQLKPKRFSYHLTPRGAAFLPVLQALCVWGNAHLPGTWTPPAAFMARTVDQ